MPEEERYDGYLQLENGVGMLRLLFNEFEECFRKLKGDGRRAELSAATGKLAFPYIRRMADRIEEKYSGVKVHVYCIRNDFFGEKITVSGLITGQDIIAQLKGKALGSRLLLPCNMLKADEIIIATGAKPRKLNIPGFDKTIEACDYLNGKAVGNNVVVIGGGLTGSEIAYELALEGMNVTIVEMKNDLIAQKGVCLANSSYLREWFALNKTSVYLGATVKEVKDSSIIIKTKEGEDKEIPCDSVISSVGYIPAPLTEAKNKVHLVGDCLSVGNLRSVIWRAYEVAMKI